MVEELAVLPNRAFEAMFVNACCATRVQKRQIPDVRKKPDVRFTVDSAR
ncbi:hypothetical protein [Methanoculleus caldifontis]|nr:hypothetical protein [Methanoculleus sp. Wushi-C6]